MELRPVARALVLTLAACAPEEAPRGPATAVELAVRSRDDFAANEAGLITPATLERWVRDWTGQRPAGVEGELIVLQFDAAAGELPWLANTPGVRAYHAAELTRLSEPRNNGIAAIGLAPSNGIRIDSFMRRFNIHPNRDLVVFVTGKATPESFAVLSRAWLTFRYWGWEHSRLALVNGDVASLPAALRAASVDAHPFTGDVRIGTVTNEHFVLLADLAAVRSAIGTSPIIDVRAPAEFEGAALSATPHDLTCLEGNAACTPTFSGRIASARNVPVTSLQHADGTFRALGELDAATASIDRAQTAFIYDGDGDDSAIATFALTAIVGQPARWYAGSFLEWGALNASHPNSGLRALPTDSPWRTDTFPALTEGASEWSTVEHGVRPLVFDPNAKSSDGVQQSDVSYKQNPPALPAVGAGEGGC